MYVMPCWHQRVQILSALWKISCHRLMTYLGILRVFRKKNVLMALYLIKDENQGKILCIQKVRGHLKFLINNHTDIDLAFTPVVEIQVTLFSFLHIFCHGMACAHFSPLYYAIASIHFCCRHCMLQLSERLYLFKIAVFVLLYNGDLYLLWVMEAADLGNGQCVRASSYEEKLLPWVNKV